ncbi:MAG: tRNA (N6-threonylcarbamoyladenosine(37)-N6)-methyltransferase TrmO [Methanoregulaceae archaeon]
MNTIPGDESKFVFRPIGTIRSPYQDLVGMPIQPAGARGVQGTIEIQEEYREGLLDIEQFSHIILIYALHRCRGYNLLVTPFLDTRQHGIFATRAPKRPNPIGISIVKLVRVDGTRIHIEDVDVLDGTPLLDIKPYIPVFDAYPDATPGWFSGCEGRVATVRSDHRFQKE